MICFIVQSPEKRSFLFHHPWYPERGTSSAASYVAANQSPATSANYGIESTYWAMQHQSSNYSGYSSGSDKMNTPPMQYYHRDPPCSMNSWPSWNNFESVSRTSRAQNDVHLARELDLGRTLVCLYLPCDDEALSPYQCMVRQQIELFEAVEEDVNTNAQGRNRPICLGQVGIRCRHCSFLPPKLRSRGAMYYPTKLEGLYQATQNMATGHLCEYCPQIPDRIKHTLRTLRDDKASAGGGKKYWADGVRALGVYESNGILRFKKP